MTKWLSTQLSVWNREHACFWVSLFWFWKSVMFVWIPWHLRSLNLGPGLPSWLLEAWFQTVLPVGLHTWILDTEEHVEIQGAFLQALPKQLKRENVHSEHFPHTVESFCIKWDSFSEWLEEESRTWGFTDFSKLNRSGLLHFCSHGWLKNSTGAETQSCSQGAGVGVGGGRQSWASPTHCSEDSAGLEVSGELGGGLRTQGEGEIAGWLQAHPAWPTCPFWKCSGNSMLWVKGLVENILMWPLLTLVCQFLKLPPPWSDPDMNRMKIANVN